MSLKTCTACKGKRTYTVTESEKRYSGKSYHLTGRTVTRIYPSQRCGGSGKLDIDAIRDAAYFSAVNTRVHGS